MNSYSIDSSYIEKIIEHIFLSEILTIAWKMSKKKINVIRPEVDNSGYDLILECNGIMKFIQLKSSSENIKKQNINSKLFEKKEFAVILAIVDKEEMNIKEYYYYADKNIVVTKLKSAKHNKANSKGVKTERPNIKEIPNSGFVKLNSIMELLEKLFPDIKENNSN